MRSYVLHLTKDVGRWYLWCYHNVNATVFLGVDGTCPDSHGYQTLNKTVVRGTIGHNKTMQQLLQHHLDTCKDHLIFWEDDILPHNKFSLGWKTVRKFMSSDTPWNIIFLGESSGTNTSERSWDSFKVIPKNGRCSGGFGVVVHRDKVKELLNIAQDTPLNKPFDTVVLEKLRVQDPTKCFTIRPDLVITSVGFSSIRPSLNNTVFSNRIKWKVDNYLSVDQYPLYVVGNKDQRIKRLMDRCTTLQPIFKATKDKINKDTKYFGVVNQEVDWGFLPEDTVMKILKSLETHDCVIPHVVECRRCKEGKVVPNPLNYMAFYSNRCKDLNRPQTISKIDMEVYITTKCAEVSPCDNHTITEQDIAADIQEYLKSGTITRRGLSSWKRMVISWAHMYLTSLKPAKLRHKLSINRYVYCIKDGDKVVVRFKSGGLQKMFMGSYSTLVKLVPGIVECKIIS